MAKITQMKTTNNILHNTDMPKSSISHKDPPTPTTKHKKKQNKQSGPLHKEKVKKMTILFQDANIRTTFHIHAMQQETF
jgi:hypothetical protein